MPKHAENLSLSPSLFFFFLSLLPAFKLLFFVFNADLSPLQVPEFDGKNLSSVMGFESNQLPANAPIEDRRSAATCLQTRGMLLGVFDGHAGCACAQVEKGGN